MQNEQFNEWDSYPYHLNTGEIAHPLLVLADFFRDDWLPDQLTRLKGWRDFVLKDAYYLDEKNSPAGLLHFYQLNIRLIEAIHLLNTSADSFLFQAGKEQLVAEQSNWRDYPAILAEKEKLNPLAVLQDCFQTCTLQQYRENLYEWLQYGLSASAADEFITTVDLIVVYENLQKLYGAAWLIHQRSTDKPYLKLGNDQLDRANEATTEPIPMNLMPNLSAIRIYKPDCQIHPEQTELLSGLVSIIKHKVATVQAIIYLGASPVQPDRLFLLVLTADAEQGHALSLGSQIEESCRKICAITVLVHYSSAFLNGVREVNRFFNNALACPVIYLSGELILPAPKPVSRFFYDHPELLLWERWHRQGKEFLAGAGFYLDRGAEGPALFLMHQCVESTLIAIIRVVLGYRINAHNLAKLLSITKMFTDDIAAVFDLNSEEGKQQFRFLMDAYINVRYREILEPGSKYPVINSPVTLYPVIKELVTVTEKVYEKYLMLSTI